METNKINDLEKGQRVSFWDCGHTVIGEILVLTDSTLTIVHGSDGSGYRTTDVHWTKVTPGRIVQMKTIGYVRVSTERQAERGSSLEAQAEKIRAMALVQGVELADIIVESGESAKSLNRTGMSQLLAMVEAGKVKAVIVAKLDRADLGSVKDLCELLERFERKGVALVSVAESLDTGSAAGRLVLNIMAAVSQWEREAIGERTKDALSHKRSQGQRVGNIAFGYRLAADGLHLEADPGEQGALAEIRRLRSQGQTLRGIAATLNQGPLRTRRGTAWRLESVARIVKQSSF